MIIQMEENNLEINIKDILFLLFGSILAGLIAKIPSFSGLIEDEYYAKNIHSRTKV